MPILRIVLLILILGVVLFFIIKLAISLINNTLEEANSFLRRYDTIIALTGTFLAAVPILIALLENVGESIVEPYKISKTAKEKNREILERYDHLEKNIPFKYKAKPKIDGKDLKVKFSVEENPRFDSNDFDLTITGYPPGMYTIESVPNGEEFLDNFIDIIVNFLLENQHQDVEIDIKIFGQADGIPTSGRVYSGDLGAILDEDYYSYDSEKLLKKSLYPGYSILRNEDYAFLRAYALKKIFKSNEYLYRAKFSIYTNTVAVIGDEHRKIVVDINIKDAFKKDYESFNQIEKFVFDGKILNAEEE